MFVLKGPIEKYTSVKSGKLYAWFVGFQKAFDSVIHPGLRDKLKSLNINGKSYDMLCSTYSKSQTCVRIVEHRTDFFRSKVGVRQGDLSSPNLFKYFIYDLPMFLQNQSLIKPISQIV